MNIFIKLKARQARVACCARALHIKEWLAEVEREKVKAERQIKQYAKSQNMASAKVRQAAGHHVRIICVQPIVHDARVALKLPCAN